MSTIIAYRDKVRDAIKNGVPGLRSVITCAGKITPEQIKKIASDAPAIAVVAVGIGKTKVDSRGMIWGELTLGCLCIARDLGPKSPVENAVWDMAIQVTKLASMNRFDHEPASPVTGFHVDNLMNDEMLEDGGGIIGISWDVFVELGNDHFTAAATAAGWGNAMFPDDVAVTVNDGPLSP